MKNVAEQQPQAPPGIIATLTAGFELTTAHLWLIVLPIMLDVVYWLGPRLGIVHLSDRLLSPLMQQQATQEAVKQIIDMAADINILTSLSVPVIGVPALMSGVAPEKTPLPVQVYQLDSTLGLLALQVGLTLAGLFLTAVYLSLISLAIQDKADRPANPAAFVMTVLRSAVRLFGLGVIFLIVLIAVWVPLLPVAFVAGLLTGVLAMYVMLAGALLVVTYLCMSVPGIVFKRRPVLLSVWESVRMVRGNVLQTISLLLLVMLVSGGTNQLWRMADDGSWLTMISIAGHAFISTALAAAIFVFYRDRWAYAEAQMNQLDRT
jgi:hypothetical protein